MAGAWPFLESNEVASPALAAVCDPERIATTLTRLRGREADRQPSDWTGHRRQPPAWRHQQRRRGSISYLCCGVAACRDSTSIVAWRALVAPPCGTSCCETAENKLSGSQESRDQRRFGPSAAAVRGVARTVRRSGAPGWQWRPRRRFMSAPRLPAWPRSGLEGSWSAFLWPKGVAAVVVRQSQSRSSMPRFVRASEDWAGEAIGERRC